MSNCTKKPFGSKREAKDFIKKYGRRNGLRARHVYECETCGAWHMTSHTAGERWIYFEQIRRQEQAR